MPRLKVELSRDNMAAYGIVFPDDKETSEISVAEIKTALGIEGAEFGIDEAEVERLVDAPYGTRVTLARGTEPKDGSDAVIRYKISLRKEAPLELDDGRVDYKELELVKNVVKGQVLVVKDPMIPGIPGRNVRGKEIPPRSVKDKDLPAGRNTIVTPDGLKLLSAIDGHVIVSEGLINVDETFTLNISVGPRTGNINCVKHCVIRGGVADGFKVTAGGNITIMGEVEGAEVVSHGGDIRIEKGMRGHIKGIVRSAGMIKARFVENATMEAEGDIVIDEHLYHSRIRTKGKLKVLGTPGVIMGGEIETFHGVECEELGSSANPKTFVYMGDFNLRGLRERQEEIIETVGPLKARLAPARGALEEMQRIMKEKEPGTEERLKELAKMAEPFKTLTLRIRELEEEAERIKTLIKESPPLEPVVTVRRRIYPGVSFAAFPNQEVSIRDEKRGVKVFPSDKGFRVKKI